MSDRVAKWRQSFQKARSNSAQVQADLQKLELLSAQDVNQRSERAKLSAGIRGKMSQLKIELERLQRELQSLADNSSENEVTRKSITQFKDELAQAMTEQQELQRRLQRPQAAESSPAPASGEVAKRPSERGAEMQPVSQRSMLERQQQMMRDMDEPLTVLEGSVNNLQQVSTMIRTEINLQNRLLDNANETTDRTSARLGRARSMLTRFQTLDRHRCLGIAVIALFIALVILFVYE
ncbi:SYP51, partial [Symbiodinium microadriaticum]